MGNACQLDEIISRRKRFIFILLATAFTCSIIMEFIQDNQMEKSKQNPKIEEKSNFTYSGKSGKSNLANIIVILINLYNFSVLK